MTTLPTFYVVMYQTDDGMLVWDDPWDAYGTAEEARIEQAKVRRDNLDHEGANVVQRVIAVYRCTPEAQS